MYRMLNPFYRKKQMNFDEIREINISSIMAGSTDITISLPNSQVSVSLFIMKFELKKLIKELKKYNLNVECFEG